MKKLELSSIVEGVRKLGAVKAVFEHMQEAMTEGFAAVLKGITAQSSGVVAMFGMVDTGGGAPNYNISAGWAYYQGELYEVDAFAGAAGGGEVPVLTLVTTQRAEDPLIYSDGNTFDTLDVRKLAWSFAATGSGLADLDDVLTLSNLINSLIDVPGQINAVIDAAPGALDTLNELAAALGDDPNFAATVTSALAGKLSNAAGAVGNSNLASNAVSTSKIEDDAVTAAKVNTTVCTSSVLVDADTRFHPGLYATSTNVPGAGLLIVTEGPGVDQYSQWCIATATGDVYRRLYNAGSWGSWTLINDASA